MKVEEAKKKICPFISNMVLDADKLFMPATSSMHRCICEECMAWVMTKTHRTINAKRRPVPEDEKEGYCVRLKEI